MTEQTPPTPMTPSQAAQEKPTSPRTDPFPNATPRPWTIDMIEGGGWAVVVDADSDGARVIAELDDTVGDRAANAALIVEAVNRFNGPVALSARVRQRITDAFEGEYSEQEALEAFAEDGWPGDWPAVNEHRPREAAAATPSLHDVAAFLESLRSPRNSLGKLALPKGQMEWAVEEAWDSSREWIGDPNDGIVATHLDVLADSIIDRLLARLDEGSATPDQGKGEPR